MLISRVQFVPIQLTTIVSPSSARSTKWDFCASRYTNCAHLPIRSSGCISLHIRRKIFHSSRTLKLTKSRCLAALTSHNSVDSSTNNSEDFITRILRENPAELEIYGGKDGNLYTRPVKNNGLSSVSYPGLENGVEKSKNLFSEAFGKLKHIILKRSRSKSDNVFQEITRENAKPVYLEDLLRQYRGQLYVPEEAFKYHVPDIDEFNRTFDALPQMSKHQFLRAVKKNRIKMLTSRAVLSHDGVPKHYDVIVELKDHSEDKRAMSLSNEEAQDMLKQYSGPQREVEKLTSTAYVAGPPSVPHVGASSISSRVLLELSVLLTYAFYAMGGIVLVPMLGVITLAASFLSPFLGSLYEAAGLVFQQFVKGMFEATFRNVFQVFNTIIEFVTSQSVKAMVISTFYMTFVLISMVALVKYTITRRPKDYTQWDIWQCLEFSQSKPQARVEGTTGVKFEDVAGIDEVVEELKDLVRYLKKPDVYNKMGSKPPHGVLLEGPPGCGKTLLAKAIAGEAGVPFYQMAGSEFDELIVGVGAARVRDLFKRAQANKPAVVFIDEIDALGMRRNDYNSQGGGDGESAFALERETTLNQLLTELDGFDTGKGVIFIGATNRMDLLDPALLRPGRFDRKISINPPDAKGCTEILKVHAKKVKVSPSVDLSFYAKLLAGWSGAQLEQLLQEAALMALRNHHDTILPSDFEKAINRLSFGPEHPDVIESPYIVRKAASEVGIALTSHLLRRLENASVEPCISVSIVPTGTTLTRTTFDILDDEAAYNLETRAQLLHRLQVFLGGRAAEEVMFGRDTSTCSLTHLPDASWLARKIISIWNLDDGFTVHGERAPWKRMVDNTGPVLAFEGSLYDDYVLYGKSLNPSLDSDVAVRTEKLINDVYCKTVALLENHHAALAKCIRVIKETWELRGEDLDLILDLYPANTPLHILESEESPASLPSRETARVRLEKSKQFHYSRKD